MLGLAMITEETRRARLRWLAVSVYGISLFLMLAVSAALFRSASFADQLARFVGHPVSVNQRLAASLGIGLAIELAILVVAYLLFPRKRGST